MTYSLKDCIKNSIMGALICLSTHGALKDPNFLYADVFTRDIYDQTELKRRVPKPSESQALEELYRLKMEAVGRRMDWYCMNNLHDLLAEANRNGDNAAAAGTILKELSKYAFKAKKYAGNAVGILLEIFVGWQSEDRQREHMRQSVLSGKLVELQYLDNLLKGGIKTESVSDLEETYVKAKAKNETWAEYQQTVEEALLSARQPRAPFSNVKTFLAEALSIPGERKALLDVRNPQDSFSQRLTEFRGNSFFRELNPELNVEVWHLIMHLCFSSIESRNDLCLRALSYFSGDKGVGKTRTAKEICKFLGLSYVEVSLRGDGDISSSSLEGEQWDRHNAQQGMLLRPFLARNGGDGKSYMNAVLIINDFDRMFLLNPERSASAMGFLLDYLDPMKRQFWSRYLQSPLNMSYLSVIITGNGDIPTGKDDPKKIYEALEDRLDIFKFPPLTTSFLRGILTSHLETLRDHYKVAAISEIDRTKLIEETLKESKIPLSIRNSERLLKRKFQDHILSSMR